MQSKINTENLDPLKNLLEEFQRGKRDFSGANLENIDLSRTNLQSIRLCKANLQGANLSGTDLSKADLTGADLRGANLNNAILKRANVSWANLTHQNLSGANLETVDFQGANLSQANLNGANLRLAKLDAANLQGATLKNAVLTYAYLPYAQLIGADLSNTELMHSDLTGANLESCILRQANLTRSRLRKANLQQANLQQTCLKDCQLDAANLTRANLQKADLSDAILQDAILTQTDLRGAEITEVKKANLEFAIVGDLDWQIKPILHLELKGNSFAFSPNSDKLAYVSYQYKANVIVVDLNTGKQSIAIDVQSEPIVSVVFSADGQQIIQSFYVNELKLWNGTTGEFIQDLKQHSANITAQVLNQDGMCVGMIGMGEPFELFDVGHEVRTFKGYSSGISTQAHSSDGKFTARSAPELEGQIEIQDRQTSATIHILEKGVAPVQSLAFSPDSQTLASYSSEDFRLWDVSTGQITFRALTSQLSYFPFVDFLQDEQANTSILMTSHFYSAFKYRDATFMQNGIDWNASGSGSSSSAVAALSANRKVLARHYGKQPIQLWNLETGKELGTVKLESGGYPLSLSPSGHLLAFGNKPGICVWDIQKSQQIQSFEGHSDSINTIIFSPDSQIVASGSWDSSIKLWNIRTGLEIATLRGYACIVDLAFSPIEPVLASLSKDGTIKFWNVETMEEIHSFKGHKDDAESIAFSPDGQWLASCDRNSTRLWKLERNP